MFSRWFTSLSVATATAFACGALSSGAEPDPLKQVEIPYKRFVLPNGLTPIVHEDHKAPIVVCNIWYHVGSKNERLATPVLHTYLNT